MRLPHAAFLVAGTLVLAPSAHAATNPHLSGAQLKRSFDSLGGLVSSLPRSTATDRLRGLMTDVRRSIQAGRPCEASAGLRSLRVRAGRQGSLPLQARGDIAAASLNSEVVLLSRAGATACGGPEVRSAPRLATRVLASSPAELKVRVAFPTPQFIGRQGGARAFAQLAMRGMGGGAIGKPEIPLTRRAFAIPEGAKVSFATSRRHTMTLRGVDLLPLQPGSDAADPPITTFPGAHSPLFATPAFARDAATYASRSPYPARTFVPRPGGDWRGFRLATFDVAAGQYAPAARVLKVATAVDVTIRFAGGTAKFNSKQVITKTNRHMLNVFKASVVNAGTALAVANLKDLVLRPCGEEVMIITEPHLRAAADRLAANKRARGLSTTVFEVGAGAGQVGTTAPAIYDFIRARRQADCGTTASFLILFGKGVPTFARPNERDPTNTEKLVVGDFDYVVASPSFLLPVMHVGRIPATTVDEGNAAVDKIEGWESTAPADAGFYKRTAVAGFFQIDAATSKERESRDFIQQIERVRDGIVAGGSSADRFYVKDTGATPKYFADGTLMPSAVRNHSWASTNTQIVNAINDGRSLLVHNDHGYTGGWGDPSLSTADIPQMTNGNELPLMFSVNCSSGHFDDPGFKSFAEQMFLRPGGGAIGVVAGSRMTNTWANGFVALGLTDAVYPQTLPDFGGSAPITGLGEILTMGKIALWLTFPTDYQGDNGVTGDDFVRDHWRLYNLFGDPTVHIRTGP